MLTIISPSKTQDFTPNQYVDSEQMPELVEEAKVLAEICKKLKAEDIAAIMKLSPKLALSTYEKFQNFGLAGNNKKPAIFAYTGDVYNAMNPAKYDSHDLQFANKHLRIISGMYGLLAPLDLIEPYRLEMSIKINNFKGDNLYSFWQDKITKKINEILATHKQKYIINLASNEYASAIALPKLQAPIINITFKENRQGKLKTIGLLAKKARGMMADFIISNNAEEPEVLKTFKGEYHYKPDLSNNREYVFVR